MRAFAVCMLVSLMFPLVAAQNALAEDNAGQAETAAMTEAAPEYVLGPGDVLEVFIWEEPDLSRMVTVRPDGRISYPLVPDIMAAGRTIAELREAMEKEVYKITPDVPISIILNTSAKRYYVIGESGSSVYSLTGPIRVMQALAVAGGINEFGDKDILIIRDEGGKQRVLKFDYGKVEKGKHLEQNVFLINNDTIIVR